jgi:hypothetical protein
VKIIDEIRDGIAELEKKNYEVKEIRLSKDIIELLSNRFNSVFGDNVVGLTGINTLFGYDVSYNIFDDTPVAFDVRIKIEDIIGSDKVE